MKKMILESYQEQIANADKAEHSAGDVTDIYNLQLHMAKGRKRKKLRKNKKRRPPDYTLLSPTDTPPISPDSASYDFDRIISGTKQALGGDRSNIKTFVSPLATSEHDDKIGIILKFQKTPLNCSSSPVQEEEAKAKVFHKLPLTQTAAVYQSKQLIPSTRLFPDPIDLVVLTFAKDFIVTHTSLAEALIQGERFTKRTVLKVPHSDFAGLVDKLCATCRLSLQRADGRAYNYCPCRDLSKQTQVQLSPIALDVDVDKNQHDLTSDHLSAKHLWQVNNRDINGNITIKSEIEDNTEMQTMTAKSLGDQDFTTANVLSNQISGFVGDRVHQIGEMDSKSNSKRKLPPLKISRKRIKLPVEETDDDRTPEYPLKEGSIFSNPRSFAKDSESKHDTNTDAGEHNRNIFSNMSSWKLSSSDRQMPSQEKKPVASEKVKCHLYDSQATEKSFSSHSAATKSAFMTLPIDALKLPKDIAKSQLPRPGRVQLFPKMLPDNSQLDERGKSTTSDKSFSIVKPSPFNDTKITNDSSIEDADKYNEQIPHLSPVKENSMLHMLPSPMCAPNPPTLDPFCDDGMVSSNSGRRSPAYLTEACAGKEDDSLVPNNLPADKSTKENSKDTVTELSLNASNTVTVVKDEHDSSHVSFINDHYKGSVEQLPMSDAKTIPSKCENIAAGDETSNKASDEPQGPSKDQETTGRGECSIKTLSEENIASDCQNTVASGEGFSKASQDTEKSSECHSVNRESASSISTSGDKKSPSKYQNISVLSETSNSFSEVSNQDIETKVSDTDTNFPENIKILTVVTLSNDVQANNNVENSRNFTLSTEPSLEFPSVFMEGDDIKLEFSDTVLKVPNQDRQDSITKSHTKSLEGLDRNLTLSNNPTNATTQVTLVEESLVYKSSSGENINNGPHTAPDNVCSPDKQSKKTAGEPLVADKHTESRQPLVTEQRNTSLTSSQQALPEADKLQKPINNPSPRDRVNIPSDITPGKFYQSGVEAANNKKHVPKLSEMSQKAYLPNQQCMPAAKIWNPVEKPSIQTTSNDSRISSPEKFTQLGQPWTSVACTVAETSLSENSLSQNIASLSSEPHRDMNGNKFSNSAITPPSCPTFEQEKTIEGVSSEFAKDETKSHSANVITTSQSKSEMDTHNGLTATETSKTNLVSERELYSGLHPDDKSKMSPSKNSGTMSNYVQRNQTGHNYGQKSGSSMENTTGQLNDRSEPLFAKMINPSPSVLNVCLTDANAPVSGPPSTGISMTSNQSHTRSSLTQHTAGTLPEMSTSHNHVEMNPISVSISQDSTMPLISLASQGRNAPTLSDVHYTASVTGSGPRSQILNQTNGSSYSNASREGNTINNGVSASHNHVEMNPISASISQDSTMPLISLASQGRNAPTLSDVHYTASVTGSGPRSQILNQTNGSSYSSASSEGNTINNGVSVTSTQQVRMAVSQQSSSIIDTPGVGGISHQSVNTNDKNVNTTEPVTADNRSIPITGHTLTVINKEQLRSRKSMSSMTTTVRNNHAVPQFPVNMPGFDSALFREAGKSAVSKLARLPFPMPGMPIPMHLLGLLRHFPPHMIPRNIGPPLVRGPVGGQLPNVTVAPGIIPHPVEMSHRPGQMPNHIQQTSQLQPRPVVPMSTTEEMNLLRHLTAAHQAQKLPRGSQVPVQRAEPEEEIKYPSWVKVPDQTSHEKKTQSDVSSKRQRIADPRPRPALQQLNQPSPAVLPSQTLGTVSSHQACPNLHGGICVARSPQEHLCATHGTFQPSRDNTLQRLPPAENQSACQSGATRVGTPAVQEELPSEPLDLSQPKRKQNTNAVDLSSHKRPNFQLSPHSTSPSSKQRSSQYPLPPVPQLVPVTEQPRCPPKENHDKRMLSPGQVSVQSLPTTPCTPRPVVSRRPSLSAGTDLDTRKITQLLTAVDKEPVANNTVSVSVSCPQPHPNAAVLQNTPKTLVPSDGTSILERQLRVAPGSLPISQTTVSSVTSQPLQTSPNVSSFDLGASKTAGGNFKMSSVAHTSTVSTLTTSCTSHTAVVTSTTSVSENQIAALSTLAHSTSSPMITTTASRRNSLALSDISTVSCYSRPASVESTETAESIPPEVNCAAKRTSAKKALPVKDFFTSTCQENTYSSLVMAKITSQNKRSRELLDQDMLLPFDTSQTQKENVLFEIDNRLQKNQVIDLTEDCDVVSVSSNDSFDNRDVTNEFLDGSTRDNVQSPASTAGYSNITEAVDENGVFVSSNLPSGVSDVSISVNIGSAEVGNEPCSAGDGQTDQVVKMVSSGSTNTASTGSIYKENAQDNHGQTRDRIHIATVCGPVNGPVIESCQNLTPAHPEQVPISLSIDDVQRSDPLYAVSAAPLPNLRIVQANKEYLANKVKAAVTSRRSSTDETTIESASTADTSSVQSTTPARVPGTDSHHDNSTQRAAATLLELSANPLYNTFAVIPETSDSYQEKVYQVHPTLDEDKAARERSRINPGLVESDNVSGNLTNKPGARTGRRVGRPPKDQVIVTTSTTSVSENQWVALNTLAPSTSSPMITTAATSVPCSFQQPPLVMAAPRVPPNVSVPPLPINYNHPVMLRPGQPPLILYPQTTMPPHTNVLRAVPVSLQNLPPYLSVYGQPRPAPIRYDPKIANLVNFRPQNPALNTYNRREDLPPHLVVSTVISGTGNLSVPHTQQIYTQNTRPSASTAEADCVLTDSSKDRDTLAFENGASVLADDVTFINQPACHDSTVPVHRTLTEGVTAVHEIGVPVSLSQHISSTNATADSARSTNARGRRRQGTRKRKQAQNQQVIPSKMAALDDSATGNGVQNECNGDSYGSDLLSYTTEKLPNSGSSMNGLSYENTHFSDGRSREGWPASMDDSIVAKTRADQEKIQEIIPTFNSNHQSGEELVAKTREENGIQVFSLESVKKPTGRRRARAKNEDAGKRTTGRKRKSSSSGGHGQKSERTPSPGGNVGQDQDIHQAAQSLMQMQGRGGHDGEQEAALVLALMRQKNIQVNT